VLVGLHRMAGYFDLGAFAFAGELDAGKLFDDLLLDFNIAERHEVLFDVGDGC
jgi:hypothetical protein